MRGLFRVLLGWVLSAVAVCGLSACTAKAPVKGPAATGAALYEETPVPTVPPATPTPPPIEVPVPTRPIGKAIEPRGDQPVGPVVTFFGAARADGVPVEPESVDGKGIPTYKSAVGSGFMIVIEAKPGEAGHEVGRRIFAHVPDDPSIRPDLEIQADRNLGNGSRDVCDRRRPKIGGIPRIRPPSFAATQRVSDAINDFACRFETFIESASSCTMTKEGNYAFVKPDTTTQFCMIVARAYAFPVGRTLLSLRLRDTEGYPGPVARMRILRPPEPKPKR